MKNVIRLSVAAAVVALAGCGGGLKTGSVRGKVTLDGEPITSGTVGFVAADGRVETAMIQPDGTYEIKKAPAGDVVVTVQTYPPSPTMHRPDEAASKTKVARPTYQPIPPHYGDSKQSPLKYAVKAGEQEYEVALSRRPK